MLVANIGATCKKPARFLQAFEVLQILPALSRIDKLDCLDTDRGCCCQVFTNVINKDRFSGFQLILGQQVLVYLYFRFNFLYSTRDDDAVKHIPEPVCLFKLGNRRRGHI